MIYNRNATPFMSSHLPRVKSNDTNVVGILEAQYDLVSDSTERCAEMSRRLPLAW